MDLDEDTFIELIDDALASIPAPLSAAMRNVHVLVEDENPDQPDLLGLYEGIPLTERTDAYAGALPDRITIYRLPIAAMCETVFEAADEVRITVLHEVAHHFGIDDEALHDWGWG